jgi:hypothetical protein
MENTVELQWLYAQATAFVFKTFNWEPVECRCFHFYL